MTQDPIVEEVRRHRQQYAAQFNFDLHSICRDLRERQKMSDRKVVRRSPRGVGHEEPEGQPAS